MKITMVLLCVALVLPASAQIQQGVTLFEQGRDDAAKKVLTPLQNDPEAVKTLGLIAQAEGDDDRAIELFEKAVTLRPSSGAYHYRLGEAVLAKGENASVFARPSLIRRSTAELEKAVSLDPDHVEAELR